MSPRARHARSKARLGAYEKLFAGPGASTASRSISARARLGGDRAKDVTKGFGDRLLFQGLSFTLPPAGIVGVVRAERRGQDDARR
jgi:hypothetical protein